MRYFFHYRDSQRYYLDGEGDELIDLDAARTEGRLSARDLLGSEHGESDPAFLGGSYEITDHQGTLLAVVTFEDASA